MVLGGASRYVLRAIRYTIREQPGSKPTAFSATPIATSWNRFGNGEDNIRAKGRDTHETQRTSGLKLANLLYTPLYLKQLSH